MEETKPNAGDFTEIEKLSNINRMLQAAFYIVWIICGILWSFKLLPI